MASKHQKLGVMMLARMISTIEIRHRAPDFQETLKQQVEPAAEITLQAAGDDADDRADRRQCKAERHGDAETIDKPRHDVPCLIVGAKPICG